MNRWWYQFGVWCYTALIYLLYPYNKKAKLWVNGRKNVFKKLSEKIDNKSTFIWVHCASLGEFEQGRPLIEYLKTHYPQYQILLTFFSPSGFEIRKNYQFADVVTYLPIDTKTNARKLIKLVNPKLVFFIKYEFWYNYLRQLHLNNIPFFLISGIFRPKHYFFKWYGSWFRMQLKRFTFFYVQDAISEQLLNAIDITNVLICGDTRFDRVKTITENPQQFPEIEQFIKHKKTFVAGSTWPQDENIIASLIKHFSDNFNYIIVPHEISDNHINSLIKLLPKPCCKYSELLTNKTNTAPILIIDKIGLLSQIYQYATICYVGGGFGAGIHNILEPATHGKPVIFGPKYHKFLEAVNLLNLRGAFTINNSHDLINIVNNLLKDNKLYEQTCAISANYIKENTGVTEKIMAHLKRQHLLQS